MPTLPACQPACQAPPTHSLPPTISLVHEDRVGSLLVGNSGDEWVRMKRAVIVVSCHFGAPYLAIGWPSAYVVGTVLKAPSMSCRLPPFSRAVSSHNFRKCDSNYPLSPPPSRLGRFHTLHLTFSILSFDPSRFTPHRPHPPLTHILDHRSIAVDLPPIPHPCGATSELVKGENSAIFAIRRGITYLREELRSITEEFLSNKGNRPVLLLCGLSSFLLP